MLLSIVTAFFKLFLLNPSIDDNRFERSAVGVGAGGGGGAGGPLAITIGGGGGGAGAGGPLIVV